MAMDRTPSLTTRCVLNAVRLQCVLRCRSKLWFLHKTLVRTTGSICQVESEATVSRPLRNRRQPALRRIHHPAAVSCPPRGRALDCGDLLAFPNKVSSQAEHVSFFYSGQLCTMTDHIFCSTCLRARDPPRAASFKALQSEAAVSCKTSQRHACRHQVKC